MDTLPLCHSDFYSNISILLYITTATAEWSFSSLKDLKTYLWSTKDQDGLSGLAQLQIQVSIHEMIDQFGSSK